MIKVSDYIMDFISSLGVKHIFYVSGGGAMHLNDSLGKHPRLKGICMLHEQGAAIAAEAYARIRESFGVCLVTSGPGVTNALTGLVSAYMDSIPVIFISGQVKRDDLRENAFEYQRTDIDETLSPLRQFGIQEVDPLPMVKSYAKTAVRVKDPNQVRYQLERAIACATSCRPGPVWLDIPLDIQASSINPEEQRGFNGACFPKPTVRDDEIDSVVHLLNQARRPLILLGHGVRLSHSVEKALKLCEIIGAPIQTSWNGLDLLYDEHPLFFGRPGIVANRFANIILQQADFVLSIGSRLCLLQSGFNYNDFLKKAVLIMVDIDWAELDKKNLNPYKKIYSDASVFIDKLLARKDELRWMDTKEWLPHCQSIQKAYPVMIPEQEPQNGLVSNYHLLDELSNQMTGDDIYQFTSSGTTTDIAMKMLRLKKGQRAFSSKALAAMGFDVPSCIGSCIASGGRRTVCVSGDGSVAMNMQELEVIKRLKLPIKLFVSDNKGYAMIYGSQHANFKGRLSGCNEKSGLTLPDMAKVAKAFGIHTMHIANEKQLAKQIEEVLSFEGPVVCIVNTDITQQVLPRQANYMKEDGQMASRPLDDMTPLLPRDEYEALREYRGGE